jgi:hypothetical protein
MRILPHAKCMKSKQAGVRLQECENVIVGKKEGLIASDERSREEHAAHTQMNHDKCMRCAKEKPVKKLVRIELVKAQQRDSFLTERYR